MNINPLIFREYDIRGNVGTDLTPEFAFLLGRAYGQLAKENGKEKIAIGYDARESSPIYAAALGKGIQAEGLTALQTGMGPTPQLYYSIFAKELGGGIQVTGSHNPAHMNGFKICLGTGTLSGAQIQDIKTRMLALASEGEVVISGSEGEALEIKDQYLQEIIENCKPHMGDKKLKVVVDAGNGVGGIAGPHVLRELGVEVIELYCEPDGTFPNHHPDPTVMENLVDLIKTVKEHKADFGIGWDGDADRIGMVDQNGDVIYGDMLLFIFGRAILESEPGATIIGDVKCSDVLFDELNKLGGKAIMHKTGHSLIKSKLKETKGALAGEMSAHIFFKHRYYGFDDAIYASARMCEIASKHKGEFSTLLDGVPKMINTPEIRVDCEEEIKFKIIEEAQKVFAEYKPNTLDGIRISFDDGWGLVRASNTQPALVMRFEATSEEKLQSYKGLFEKEIGQIIKNLS